MLTLPDATWHRLLELLASSPTGVERVAYLDGIRTASGDGVVTTVTVPHAQQSAGHFAVTAEEMSRAGRHLRTHGLVRLAQVHTHPGRDVQHSTTDDALAYSRKAGAVSIVLPCHAAGDPAPTEGAVHLHDGERWRRLDQAEAELLVRVVPAVVDTRRTDPKVLRRGRGPRPGSVGKDGRWSRWWTMIWVRGTRRP